jgi:hypothetical protein
VRRQAIVLAPRKIRAMTAATVVIPVARLGNAAEPTLLAVSERKVTAVGPNNASDAPEPLGFSLVRKGNATDVETDPLQFARTTKDTVCPWRALR